MPHYESLFPGRFIKGAELTEPRTVRIVRVYPEHIENDGGGKDLKGIVHIRWSDGEGEWVLNKTNAILCEACFGTPEIGEWEGRLVTLHFDKTVRFGRETPGGIRVLGSPELKAEKVVKIKRPRRKQPDTHKLYPTDKMGKRRSG